MRDLPVYPCVFVLREPWIDNNPRAEKEGQGWMNPASPLNPAGGLKGEAPKRKRTDVRKFGLMSFPSLCGALCFQSHDHKDSTSGAALTVAWRSSRGKALRSGSGALKRESESASRFLSEGRCPAAKRQWKRTLRHVISFVMTDRLFRSLRLLVPLRAARLSPRRCNPSSACSAPYTTSERSAPRYSQEV